MLPSITFPAEELRKIVGIGFYEERLLLFLLLLRKPGLRVVFLSSLRVEEPIVDYYLRFMPDAVRPGDRLYLMAMWDPAPEALTGKLLAQADAVERLKALGEGSVLLTFNVTSLEAELATRIGASLYGCPPELIHLGSKSGSRHVARAAGVAVPEGSEDIFSMASLEAEVRKLKDRRPDAARAVVKLNEGFSGQGNLLLELSSGFGSLHDLGATFCAGEESWSSFAKKIEAGGAVVEELLEGPGLRSPSVQMRIAPDATTEVVSTHDQILGGPGGHVYLGCRFPADPAYRLEIQSLGTKVAEELARRGVIGSFGIDFVIDDGDIHLSEINLRLGGTTHPFLMARLVTDGRFDASSGELVAAGIAKCYVGTDNIKSERYLGLLPQQVIAAVDRAGLGFDQRSNTGVALHLLGAVKKFGKLGATCIADSHEEADALYSELLRVLDELAEPSR